MTPAATITTPTAAPTARGAMTPPTTTGFGVRVNAASLASLCATLSTVLPTRALLPELLLARLSSRAGSLLVTMTNGEETLTASIPTDLTVGIGTVYVPASRLTKLMHALSGPVDLRQIGATTLRIEAQDGDARLPLQLDAMWPQRAPEATSLTTTISAAHFRALANVSYAAANKDNAADLHGVELSTRDGRLVAAATNGHRLALAELPTLMAFDPIRLRPRALAYAAALFPVDADITMTATVHTALFTAGDATVRVSRYDTALPPWQRLLEAGVTARATLDKSLLLNALAFADALLPDQSDAITLTIAAGEVVLHVTNTEQGGERRMAAVTTGTATPHTLHLSRQYLLAAVKQMNARSVELGMGHCRAALHIMDDVAEGGVRQRALVMPHDPSAAAVTGGDAAAAA